MLRAMDDLKITGGVWYTASPYSKYPGGIARAHIDACKIAGALIQRGIPVYSPIAHSHPIAIYAGIDPSSHDFWLPVCEPMMKACHGMLVATLPTWEESRGIAWEMAWFRNSGKPLRFLTQPEMAELGFEMEMAA